MKTFTRLLMLLLLPAFSFAQATLLSLEKFPTSFNAGLAGPVNANYVGSAGTWTFSADPNAGIGVVGTQFYSSPYALKLVNNAGTASSIVATSPSIACNTTCATSLKISFYLYNEAVASNNPDFTLYLDVSSDNGNTWTQVYARNAIQLNSSLGTGVWKRVVVNLPVSFISSSFKYRIRAVQNTCTMTNSIYIDNIRVTIVPCTTPPGGEQCFVSPTIPNVANAKSVWTYNSDGTITIRTTFAKTFVDNTYGTNAIGWPNGHKFGDLVGSDHLELALYDNAGAKKMDFKIDYISASSSVSSGYKTLGVTGGDGKMITGTATDVVSARTSLSENFNTYNYKLTTNSPSTNANYTPNAQYPNWIYDVWYEVTVKASAFGTSGFAYPRVASVHASPSKTGNNSEVVQPGPCPGTLRVGNQVWNDFDGDGKRDSNEPGIPGATISLYRDADGNNLPDGAAIKTTTTDEAGKYLFANLEPGRYIASMPVLPGYQQSPNTTTGGVVGAPQPGCCSLNPDADIDNDNNLVRRVGPNGPGGVIYSNAITLTEGAEPTTDGDDSNGNLTFDLAECGNSFIGDFVWDDLNSNGIQDAGEPGINGVNVTITFQDGTTATTQTMNYNGQDGYYNFKNLGPGTYKISFDTPTGYYPTKANQGGDDTKDSDPTGENAQVTVTIAANQSDFTIDAGFTTTNPGNSGEECYGIGDLGCQSCDLRYPDNSNLPRSAVDFNESEVLRYAEPGPSTCGNATSQIKMWYNDEHAMTLGVRSVVVKSSSGTTTTNYPITQTPNGSACVTDPQVGTTIATGDQSGNDVADGGGRPLWPALFITDLTVNGPTSRAGDWQQGGSGIAPHKICGTWKAAVRTVDKTKNPNLVTVTPDADPAKNNWNLGSGSDVPDVGFSALKNEGYGAEVVWDINKLGLLAGHTYRLQFMVHDGDQNKTGGDVGQTCTTIVMGGAGPSNGDNAIAKATWTTNADNTVTIMASLDKKIVDNTYGSNAVDWPSAHTFNDLVTADNMQMALYDGNGNKTMDFKMDYISPSGSAPSGYKSLGVTGGDGAMIMGSASDVVRVKTSLDSNLNEKGYVLTTNSPATNSNYDPNPSYPKWDYNVRYEVTVKQSAFGASGFGYPRIVKVNASPSKVDRDTFSLTPTTDCPGSLRLGNQVWNDYDGDGKRDPNEPGIPNIAVSLYRDDNNDNMPDGAPIRTTVTDMFGHYQFINLKPGRYIASIPIIPGYQQSPNSTTGGIVGAPQPGCCSLNPDADVDNDNNAVRRVGPNGPDGIVYTNAITLSEGGEPTTDGDDANGNNTFDMALCGNSFIGDFVWNDLNGNGIQDAGEPGINGVNVTITFQDGTTATTQTITYNGQDGYYDFKNLGPGTYKISFQTPTGYFLTKANQGTDDSKDSDPTSSGAQVTVTIAANQSDFTIDAGYTTTPPDGGQQCYGLGNLGCQSCNIQYPDNSNLPRSAVDFNESEVLRYAEPGPSTCGSATSQIKMWYNDEHAMTLGVRSVVVKSSSGTTTTAYPVTPTPSSPACIIDPQVGSTIMSGDQSGNDVADGGGRPLWPALFITDLTVNGPTSRAGDWQQGGTGIPPHKICGTWKAAVRMVDKTKNPALVTVTPDADPAKNNWTLGAGSDVPDTGFAKLKNEGYGAEVVWDINRLGLIAGHTYRLQFMVHDGDQNKTGGDVGQTCTTIVMGGGSPGSGGDAVAKAVWNSNPDNTVTIKTSLDKSIVDNTYGSNAIGWPSGHTFNDLVNTDNMQLELYDGNGVKKMDLTLDYLSANGSASSGYKSLGVSGGDGSIAMGNAADVVRVKTSLDSNLNEKGYVLTSNSPATNSSYTPNPSYPNWDYNVKYEVTVNKSAFGAAGFGYPKLVKVNASPNKLGKGDILFTPTDCPGNLRVGNQVWNDYDGDGKRDVNEPGIFGAKLSIWRDNNGDNMPDDEFPIATTTSDINGKYLFSNLVAGKYIISMAIPAGYQQSPNTSTGGTVGNPQPGCCSLDPDADVDNDNNLVKRVGPNGFGGVLYTNPFTLIDGTEPTNDGDDANGNLTIDCAVCGNSFIGNYVWNDLNGNGIQDAGEPGINGVQVNILFQDGTTASTQTLTYNGDGYYDFKNLGPGTYKISFVTPSGYAPTIANQGSDDTKDSDPASGGAQVSTTIAADQSDFTIDAGFISTGPFTTRTGTTTSRTPAPSAELLDEAADMGLWPNPATNSFSLNVVAEGKGNAMVRIIDPVGKTVLTRSVSTMRGTNQVNFSNLKLASGTYTIEVSRDGKTSTKKLVIAK